MIQHKIKEKQIKKKEKNKAGYVSNPLLLLFC